MRHTGTPLRILTVLLAGLALIAVFVAVTHRNPGPAQPVPSAPAVVAVVQPAGVTPPVPAVPSARVRSPRGPAARVVAIPTSDPTRASLRAYLDPETGTFGPPPAQMQPEAGTGEVTEEPTVVQLPNGAELLTGTPPDYLIAQIDKDGHRVIRTVSDTARARLAPVPTPKPVER